MKLNISEADKKAMVRGAQMANSGMMNSAFWQEVAHWMDEIEARKAPKVVARGQRARKEA